MLTLTVVLRAILRLASTLSTSTPAFHASLPRLSCWPSQQTKHMRPHTTCDPSHHPKWPDHFCSSGKLSGWCFAFQHWVCSRGLSRGNELAYVLVQTLALITTSRNYMIPCVGCTHCLLRPETVAFSMYASKLCLSIKNIHYKKNYPKYTTLKSYKTCQGIRNSNNE